MQNGPRETGVQTTGTTDNDREVCVSHRRVWREGLVGKPPLSDNKS